LSGLGKPKVRKRMMIQPNILSILNIDIFVFVQYVFKRIVQTMEFSDLQPEEVERAANMIKAISHPMRLAILGHLRDGNQLSVTEIHKLLKIEQSTASHHLGILKDKGILASVRRGKNTLYYLKRKNLSTLVRCISECACA
jgi:DNA-binding transcriptional ArsR family regulator